MIGNNLKNCREEIEITQIKLGKILGVSSSTISNWESGYDTIPLHRLVKFCNLYYYSLDYVCSLTNKFLKSNKFIELDAKKIGNKLKRLRKYLKMSQEKFASICGMAQSTYSHYETGHKLITSFNAYSICKTFNVSMDWLINSN